MELILNSYGVALNRDNEAFVITTEEGRQRIPTEGITSIQVSKGAQLSSDAIMLAIEKEIEVVIMDRGGKVVGRIWSPKYGSVSTIRRGQLNFTFSQDAIDWIKQVVVRKIENQQALLMMFNPGTITSTTDDFAVAIRKLEDYRTKVLKLKGDTISDIASQIRGWEGAASRIYFEVINQALPESVRFDARSQHPALDVPNAFLNYGYGILYGKIEGALIKVGIDPYIGVLHRDNYNRPVLVYDVIELYRIWVDYVVFSLLKNNQITEEYYAIRDDGTYWLEPLGRRILIQSLNDYLEEKIESQGVSRSRYYQMVLYVQDLAQKFKRYK